MCYLMTKNSFVAEVTYKIEVKDIIFTKNQLIFQLCSPTTIYQINEITNKKYSKSKNVMVTIVAT